MKTASDATDALLGRGLLVLRATATALSLCFVLGGGCTLFYHDDDDDDDDDDDQVIIIVDNDSAFLTAPEDGLDPGVFAIDETLEQSELFVGRVWDAAQVGETELAAFAANVMLVNEERLALGLPVPELEYLDTRVDAGAAGDTGFGAATLSFGRRATGRAEVTARFDGEGRLVAIERVADDMTRPLR